MKLNDPPKMVHRSTMLAYGIETVKGGIDNKLTNEIYRIMRE